MTKTPVVNTHVHFPPNFSAYTTADEAIQAAVDQDVKALGISNFFDQTVYEVFKDKAGAVGITPLYGLEFITLVPELAAEQVKINDPSNPGRMYLCGKGIDPFKARSPRAEEIAKEIREGNDKRAAAMVNQLADWAKENGFDTGLTPESIAVQVADAGGVPVEWVSLQERHIAAAFQKAVSALPEEEQAEVLTKLYGGVAPEVDVEDATALQGEIRSRLLRAGTPGFAPEVPLSFDDAYEYILAMDGIPVYPTLADGTSPICPFEDPPEKLAQELLGRGIHMAELIPIRNTSACVDKYVKAYQDAGLLVIAGTEHNTPDQIPLDPSAADGELSDYAREVFFDSACVIAAHQALVAEGKPGYVDQDGNVVGGDAKARQEELAALGAEIIAASNGAPAAPALDEDLLADVLTNVAPALRALLASDKQLPVVTSDPSDLVRSVTASAAGELLATEGAVVLDIEGSDDLVQTTIDAVEQYREDSGADPVVAVIPGLVVFAAGSNLESAKAALEVYTNALRAARDATELGSTEALSDEGRTILEDWVAELPEPTATTAVPGRLEGKVVVITGAAQGFGLGIAQELIAQGANLVLADMNVEGAQAEADLMNAEWGADRAVAAKVNVSDPKSTKQLMVDVCEVFGGVDVFISNAGVLRAGSVMDQPVEDFDLVTDVNYKGYFLCVQAAAPVMAVQNRVLPHQWFDIISINSKSGLEGSKRNFAYAGSKFGGIGLTQSFALELVENGIKVNAVCPGNFLDGPLWMDPKRGLFVQYLETGKVPGAKTIEDVRRSYEAKVPMGRGCVPADLATAIYYIVDQNYETGQAVPVTGGQNMLN